MEGMREGGREGGRDGGNKGGREYTHAMFQKQRIAPTLTIHSDMIMST